MQSTVMPDGQRVNITLDGQRAAKLARLAARIHVAENPLSRSLVSSAIDDGDRDADNVIAMLNAMSVRIRPCAARPAHGIVQRQNHDVSA